MRSELARDLLQTAKDLLQMNSRRPKQAHLRRAVSSVYYALFHTLAQQCADAFIGTSKGSNRSKKAWQQVYRALEHGTAKQACVACMKAGSNFPKEIQAYAQSFKEYQEKRHSADYDPFETFTKEDIAAMIRNVKQIIDKFEASEIKHRKAFAAFALLKKR